MVIKAGLNQDNDKQRTPEFYQRGGIPIPESDVLDTVAEYNHGELDALKDIEEFGFRYVQDRANKLLNAEYDRKRDYIQGYFDALEFEGTREI